MHMIMIGKVSQGRITTMAVVNGKVAGHSRTVSTSASPVAPVSPVVEVNIPAFMVRTHTPVVKSKASTGMSFADILKQQQLILGGDQHK